MEKRLNMTIEYYNQFNDNFPESNYKVEVDKIFDILSLVNLVIILILRV